MQPRHLTVPICICPNRYPNLHCTKKYYDSPTTSTISLMITATLSRIRSSPLVMIVCHLRLNAWHTIKTKGKAAFSAQHFNPAELNAAITSSSVLLVHLHPFRQWWCRIFIKAPSTMYCRIHMREALRPSAPILCETWTFSFLQCQCSSYFLCHLVLSQDLCSGYCRKGRLCWDHCLSGSFFT